MITGKYQGHYEMCVQNFTRRGGRRRVMLFPLRLHQDLPVVLQAGHDRHEGVMARGELNEVICAS
jgi:hypothetical protein